jgi:di/tricarboxylate transporter
MTTEQMLISGILAATVAMFLWGRWRHDMVAGGALLACVFAGLISPPDAFLGFGHPAVITVACVLVLSKGLENSGAVDAIVRRIVPAAAGPTVTIASLTGIAAVLSGFMNNVGALALLMPVAMQVAARRNLPPGQILMPLAFGSILGGMTTMIGTPPNLIVSGFRAQNGVDHFSMFDFTPVGLVAAAAGLVFVALVGWRLVPARKQAATEDFDTEAYLTEVRVHDGSKAAGLTLHEVEELLDAAGAQIIGFVRNDVRLIAPNQNRVVHTGDILIIEAEADTLAEVLSSIGVKLEESKRPEPKEDKEESECVQEKQDEAGDGDEDCEKQDKKPAPQEIALREFAVLPASGLSGHSASDIMLRTRYGINLLALSRQGRRSMSRLRTTTFRAGDVLLMQGPPEALSEFAANFGCVPLAERSLRIPNKRKAIISGGIMAVAIVGAAFGLLPAAVAFAAGVLASMAFRTVSLRTVYDAIDWPVIVLLGALIPVAGAMESTGTADLIARVMLEYFAQGRAIVGLAVVLIVTMFLSDLMNNAATAAVMCPIAISTAGQLGASADPFLMAVAVGASCAFLTPIGHQNNTLILGPGGFRFGDYWKLGLPLEVLVVAVSIPMLILVWPL